MTTPSLVSSRTRLGFSLGSNSFKNEQVWKPSRFTLIKLENALQLTNLPKKKKYSQTFVQRSPLGNGKETIIYRVTTTIPVNIAEYKATENLGNLSGDCNIQGDRCIQV